MSGVHWVNTKGLEELPVPRMFRCEQCGASYTRKRTLSQHRCLRAGDQCYRCLVCGQAFSQPELLTRHQHIHLETFKCPVCGKCFNNRGSLTTHHRSHKQNPYVCEYCRQSFTFKKVFDCHDCINQEFTPFTCDNCGKSFRQKQDVEQHNCAQLGDLPEEELFVQCVIEEVILVPVLSESDAESESDAAGKDRPTQQIHQDSNLRESYAVQNSFDSKWNPVVNILRQPGIDRLAKPVTEQKTATQV